VYKIGEKGNPARVFVNHPLFRRKNVHILKICSQSRFFTQVNHELFSFIFTNSSCGAAEALKNYVHLFS